MKSNTAESVATAHHNLQIAIETSGLTGSIAVLRGNTVLQATKLDPNKRTAATLAPELANMLHWCRNNENQPDFVSIADGPGSFTGLRIGVTTAKTLSYAAELPLIAVDSLAAIAAAAFSQEPNADQILAGTNAYRGQVFMAQLSRGCLLPTIDELAKFAPRDGRPSETTWTPYPQEVQVVDAQQWTQMLDSLDEDVFVTGDPVVFRDHPRLRFIDRTVPDAVGVGLLAVRASQLGIFTQPLKLTPRYLRASAAEEKAADKRKQLKQH